MKYCYACKAEWNGMTQPGARETCSRCSADLHVCRNCRFYNTRKPYECECDIDAPVYKKESANYCEDFQFRDGRPAADGTSAEKMAKERWNKLFGK